MKNQDRSERSKQSGEIGVIAGVNGAGKTSIVGSALISHGVAFTDPDILTREIMDEHPGMSLEEANSLAWRMHVGRLRAAVNNRTSYYFETTLGGDTITTILEEAIGAGMPVRVWYVGLDSVEHCIQRVRERVYSGGHDIPEKKIRGRFENSRRHLIRLLPGLTELLVLDNSRDLEPGDKPPKMPVILHWRDGRILNPEALSGTPGWAKAIVEQALRFRRDGR